MPSTQLLADIERMDRLLEYVSGINDERDSVPILIAIRDLWPLIKEQMTSNANQQNHCSPANPEQA